MIFFKNGIGIKVQKYTNKLEIKETMFKKVLLEMKINPKVFAISILTAITSSNRNLMQSE